MSEFALFKAVTVAILYMFIGAIVGALISVFWFLCVNRPKLIISGVGGGGGGNRSNQTWSIAISNRHYFLDQSFQGETARDVHVRIRLNEKKSQLYLLYWGSERHSTTTIEPGNKKFLEVFHWRDGFEGYYIADDKGNPVARFQRRELKFVIILIDKLQRKTKLKIKVEFDDTHLNSSPRLIIRRRYSLRDRLDKLNASWKNFKVVFRDN